MNIDREQTALHRRTLDTRCLISKHKLNTFSTCVLCGFVIVRLGLVVSQHCIRTDTCLSFICLFDIFGEKKKDPDL